VIVVVLVVGCNSLKDKCFSTLHVYLLFLFFLIRFTFEDIRKVMLDAITTLHVYTFYAAKFGLRNTNITSNSKLSTLNYITM